MASFRDLEHIYAELQKSIHGLHAARLDKSLHDLSEFQMSFAVGGGATEDLAELLNPDALWESTLRHPADALGEAWQALATTIGEIRQDIAHATKALHDHVDHHATQLQHTGEAAHAFSADLEQGVTELSAARAAHEHELTRIADSLAAEGPQLTQKLADLHGSAMPQQAESVLAAIGGLGALLHDHCDSALPQLFSTLAARVEQGHRDLDAHGTASIGAWQDAMVGHIGEIVGQVHGALAEHIEPTAAHLNSEALPGLNASLSATGEMCGEGTGHCEALTPVLPVMAELHGLTPTIRSAIDEFNKLKDML